MIRMRKECPEIGWGDWKILSVGSPSVLAIQYEWRNSALIVVHNFDEKPHEVRIKSTADGAERLTSLLSMEESVADEKAAHRISLGAYGYRWFRVGGMNPILRRSRE